MDPLIARLPKAELHVHVEGTLEPELIFALAERNKLEPPYPSVEAARAAYQFTDLQSFLNLYYKAMAVLRTEQDFADLAAAYLRKAKSQGVVHVELFFDPQAHERRGVRFETVLDGLWSVLSRSRADYGITSSLILCFLRDLSVASAQATLTLALPHGDRISGIGLDSAEVGNPPSRFAPVYDRARAAGWHCVAHAGEEGPPAYVWEALRVLRVERIDHGVRAVEDPALVEHLRAHRIPLTVCPLSNLRLAVVPSLSTHPLKRMLEAGLVATCNSDDPAYFGGYVADNFERAAEALALSSEQILTLARNGFEASFVSNEQKASYLASVDAAASVALS